MNRYQFVKQLGDGTYGSVILATTVESNEKVAIKKMKKKYYSWEECLNLREVKSLRKLNHANIVKLKEVIRENDMLYFVFEFMKENLYQMLKDRDKLYPESTVRNIMYQVLQGLAFMHKHGYFHRDLKPENLLCSGPDCVKIADFGLARETRSRPPYTDYVSTRWYRAPEVLLRSTNYSSPIDMWAMGTIMAEVYTLRPLFPGSSEIDELFKICSVLGTPSKAEWPEGHKLAAAMNFRWPQMVATPLKQLIPNASQDGLTIMRDMMLWAPEKRPTCQQALRHNFFRVGGNLGSNARATPQPAAQHIQQPPQVQQQPQRQTYGGPTSYQPSQVKQPMAQTGSTRTDPSPLGFASKPAHNQYGGNAPRHVAAPSQESQPAKENRNDIYGANSAKKTGGNNLGRRRWNVNMGDSTDDWLDEFDYNASKKPAGGFQAQPAQAAAPLGPIKATKPINQQVKKKDDFDDDDFFASNFGGKPNALPKIGGGLGSNARVNSGRSSASSAKQLYMSKSRYIPGKSPSKNQMGSAQKRTSPMNWNNFNKPSNFGMSNNRTNNPAPANANNNPNYTPSFGANTGANKNNTNFRAGNWTRAEPAPLTFNQPSAGRRGGPNSRTDWASKYLKS